MIFSRKSLVIMLVGLFIFLGIAATKPTEDKPTEEHKYKNLKVLPKNISKEDLDKVMDGFKTALGVKCSFCHAPSKDTAQKWPPRSIKNSSRIIKMKQVRPFLPSAA